MNVAEFLLNFLLYAGIVLIVGTPSLLINLVWNRVLRSAEGFGFWAANLITMPVLSVAYGIYSVQAYSGCSPDRGFAYFCPSPEEHLLYSGMIYFLILPVFSLCVSIPVTMWFTKRRASR